MKKIVYLFGAGASKNALPIVNEIPDRLKKLIDLIESDDYALSDKIGFKDLNLQNTQSKREYQSRMINDLDWLYSELERDQHANIDTFAKKLMLKHNFQSLNRLKIALSVFLVCEQCLNKPDKRYDTFFASILSSTAKLPENIKILSWNYDSQFELTFCDYIDINSISESQTCLRVQAKYLQNDHTDGFEIYKLNGTTGLHSHSGYMKYQYNDYLSVPFTVDFLDTVVQSYAAVNNSSSNISTSLSFAWEREPAEQNFIDSASKATKEAVALVVIGYSFPFFNREIDRKIISEMTNLKRVYFQAPDADNLLERFKAIKDDLTNIELIPKYDVEQFLLPNEL